jgi:dihydrofolate synthase/folylpolyglutamate synthase
MSTFTSRQRAEQALLRLGQLHPKLIDLGLDRTFHLLEKLGHPHLAIPPQIHVAGTNGKGSTIAFLRAMLESANKKVHAYTSPHLVRFHERIRLAGQLIDDNALADLLEEVEGKNGSDVITFFEVTTAAAMLAFSRVKADLTLLETGLGGRTDSTNVITSPLVSIITPIARDHEHFLGTTITAIATEKAGIIKPSIPVISASQHPDAEAVLRQRSAELNSPFYMLEHEISYDNNTAGDGFHLTVEGQSLTAPSPGMIGPHQSDNAALAAAALMLTMPDIPQASIAAGIRSATWPARVQKLDQGKLVALCSKGQSIWLDGAHNRHGAAALAKSLKQIHDGKWVMIAGALNTRPPADFLNELKPLLEHLITITIPDQEASLTAQHLAETANELGISATPAQDIRAAIIIARDHSDKGKRPLIMGGSLYLSGYILKENGTLPD